jgi:hypothetical protein
MSNRSKPAIQVLDVDGALDGQSLLPAGVRRIDFREWGRTLRLACTFRHFARFERDVAQKLAPARRPAITFLGSGDFHHLTLALLARQPRPFNLLVLDNHPDWMRGLPFLHCGTWLHHAARMSNVRRIFHVGGDVDFDNRYRWLAPWRLLRAGKIVVLPAVRSFRRGQWARIRNDQLRCNGAISLARLLNILHPYRAELAQLPLYISVDKDVLTASEAVVNWDSGHLRLDELTILLETFLHAARGRLAGFDTVGDWSPVAVRGALRRLLHWTEHPALSVDRADAARRNQVVNRRLLEIVFERCGDMSAPAAVNPMSTVAA